MNRRRALAAAALIVGAGAFAQAARGAAPPPQPHLTALPLHIGEWSGRDAAPLDEESERALAADAYLNRTYATSPAAAAPEVGLYVAYYAQQRPGVSIHSPLHCLPGTGWEPLEIGTTEVAGAGGATSLRRMVVRKNRDRAVVLYAYAVHGRLIASELTSKIWLVADSVRLHRSDAALVRIVVPIGRGEDSLQAADAEGLAFARRLLPLLSTMWS